MRELTPLQVDVLKCIIDHIEDTHVSPEQWEIVLGIGRHRRSVEVAVKALEKKRYIRTTYKKRRSIEVLRYPH